MTKEELDRLCMQYIGQSADEIDSDTGDTQKKSTPKKKSTKPPQSAKETPKKDTLEITTPAKEAKPMPKNPQELTRMVSRQKTAQLLTSMGIDLGVKFSKKDMTDILTHLLSANQQQLTALKKSPQTPIAIKTIIVSIENDAKNGEMETINKLWSRLFGKEGFTESTPVTATMSETTSTMNSGTGLPVVSRKTLMVIKNINDHANEIFNVDTDDDDE